MRVPAIPALFLAVLLAVAVPAAAAPPPARDRAAAATELSPDGSPLPEDLPVRRSAAPSPGPEPAGNPLRGSAAPSAAPAPAAAGTSDAEAPGEPKSACGTQGCTNCRPQIPTCKPKWEDKKTKKATFSMKCDFECVRPWEPYHQGDCCEEKTTPCGDVHVKKKLFKTEVDRVERVLKYEVVMKPAAPCCADEPACTCLGCRCLGSAFGRLFSWCH